MVYGDLKFLDIIIFAGIAIFLIFRLKNVLGKRGGFQKNQSVAPEVEKFTQENKTKPPQLKDEEKKLALVYEVLPGFKHKDFIAGAKYAFETIINAFNNGDKTILKTLLTKDVLISFEEAINNGNNNPGFQFYSLIVDEVRDVVLEKDLIKITIGFTSEQFKDNDETTVVKKKDIWTFEKNINNESPIWFLSST